MSLSDVDNDTTLADDDAAAFGLVLPEIEIKNDNFELLECNEPIVKAFFMLDDCAWQFSGMGEIIGIDFKSAQIIWKYAGIKLKPKQFVGFMLFSRTVVNEIGKKRVKNGSK